ncbi:MAG TPA: hypothetical protein VGG10_08295 [Rhizomicrobium sp.]|jgi:hypothetical protein
MEAWVSRIVAAAVLISVTVLTPLTASGDKSAAPADPALDPDVGESIIDAVADDGRLWVLGDAHSVNYFALISFSTNGTDRRLEFPSGVVSLIKDGMHLWILRARGTPGEYSLLEWQENAFALLHSIRLADAETPLALTAIAGRPTVVSNRAVYVLSESDGWITTRLQQPLGAEFHLGFTAVAASSSAKALYAGFDLGEWGGDLKRIDLATGAIDDVKEDAEPVGPVNAVIPTPADPDCVIVAVGLVHMRSSGRLHKVCGTEVSDILDRISAIKQGLDDYDLAEAFFGLATSGKGYWAVSNQALYHFSENAAPSRVQLPEATIWNGLIRSTVDANVIVLLSGRNRRFSLSGYTPLVVPLHE